MEENNPRVLKIIIDIGEGTQGTLFVQPDDDPAEIAESFLSTNGLDAALKENLVKLIKSQQKKHLTPKSGTCQKSSTKSNCSKASSLSALTDRIMKHSYRYSEASRKSSQNFNYGQLLYEKGVEMKENLRQSSEKRLQEKENLSKSHSFRPTISKNSVEIAKKSARETRLKRNNDLLEKLKSSQTEKEMKECYFVPMISERANKHSRKDIFNELYQEASAKRKPTQDLSRSTFFKKTETKTHDQIETIVDRLSSSKVKSEQELERIRQDIESGYDKTTGQKLFTPVILKKSPERGERNVWEDLYYFKQQSKKVELESEKQITLSSEKTEQMFENFKKHKFQGIFKKLDSDGDGKISSEKISIDGFDKEVVMILTPVLFEVEMCKRDIELKEFVQMMEGLYSRLGTHEKMVLMKMTSEGSTCNFSFAPTINKRSKQLASSPHLGDTIYERTKAALEIRQMKMKKVKELKEKASQSPMKLTKTRQ